MDLVEEGTIKVRSDDSIEVEADFMGRPLYYVNGEKMYRRSPYGSWVELQLHKEIVSRVLPAEDGKKIENEIFKIFLSSGSERFKSRGIRSVQEYSDFLHQDAEAYVNLYGQNPIFPPMLQSPVYFSLSKGSNWNFCNIFGDYSNPVHKALSFDEFRAHVEDVKKHFGNALSSRRSVYLGDSRAIDVDQKEILAILDYVAENLNLPIVSAFDIYSTPKKRNMIGYRDLGDHGLTGMYVYLESGSYKVIRLLNRNINITESVNDILNIKDHGIPVSVVIMAGMGGSKLYNDHVRSTANLISQLQLGESDHIYLAPVIQDADSHYLKVINEESLGALTMEQILSQMDELRKGIMESSADVNGSPLRTKIIDWDLRIPPS